MKQLSDFIDQYGLVIHKTPEGRNEGGDSAQRTGMWRIGEMLIRDPRVPAWDLTMLDHLEVSPGIYIRHPASTDTWHSDPKEFSRDQQTPLVIAMGFYNDRDRLKRLFKRHMLRFGKYQNRDWMGPEHFGQYLRAFGNKLFWPILFITDLFMIIGVLIRCWQAIDEDDVGDDLNLILSLLQARLSLPTPFSWLARKLYVTLRPHGGPQYALDYYFRHDGAPPLNEFYRPIIKRYFSIC